MNVRTLCTDIGLIEMRPIYFKHHFDVSRRSVRVQKRHFGYKQGYCPILSGYRDFKVLTPPGTRKKVPNITQDEKLLSVHFNFTAHERECIHFYRVGKNKYL